MQLNKYLLALTCAFTAAAHAENNWYVAGSIGQSSFDTSKSEFESDLDEVGIAIVSSDLEDTDTAYKLQVGYQFSPNFAIEGGYVDLGALAYNAEVTDGFSNANVKMETEAVGLNISAVGILPLSNGFSLFAKFGFINADVESSLRVSDGYDSISDSEETTDLKPTFGVGAAYSINDQLSLRAEFERYSKLGDEDTTGEGDVDLFSAGIAYRF